MIKQKIPVIIGPTASGKSGLAVQLAEKQKGSVINADSIQIYSDLSILSARPSVSETKGIPHLLYGYLDAYTQGSVQDWLNRVVPLLQNIKNPILVGGTGLYISSLINGINEIPEIDPKIRNQVRQMPIDEVKSKLKNFPFQDEQRLRRALEVLLSTGKSITYFQEKPLKKLINANFDVIFLNPPRNILYTRCEQRFYQMIEQGAISEVKHLLSLNPTGGVLKAIGVLEIRDYLQGIISKEEMIKKSILATRHYAKRQVTWFKHQISVKTEIQSPDMFFK